VSPPGRIDPVSGDIVIDGYAGARADLAAAPSVDIANGAPSGRNAPNTIVDTWNDGNANASRASVRASTNGGRTWSGRFTASEAGDRAMYSAAGISPNGRDLYVVYDAFLTPFQTTTAHPRVMQGVVRHADLVGRRPTNWTTLDRGARGDARASSANALFGEFLGDYNYAAATNSFGVAVWNDVRNAQDCPAIDAYRQSLIDQAESSGHPIVPDGEDTGTPAQGTQSGPPAVQEECPPAFGNSDIYGGQFTP